LRPVLFLHVPKRRKSGIWQAAGQDAASPTENIRYQSAMIISLPKDLLPSNYVSNIKV
jgi:hypothetical protein